MSTAAPTVTLYRSLVPAHVGVPSAVVTTFLGLAVEEHTAAAWGAAYAQAMVWHAAAQIEPDVVAGAYPIPSADGSGDICAPSGPPKDAAGNPVAIPAPEDTRYWKRYLELRVKRAAGAPRRVGGAC